jgi:hypothetical protein
MFLLSAISAALAGIVTGATPPDGIGETYKPRRVAVLIGIDTYEDPELVGLQFAAKDAEDMARVLQDPDLGGFDEVILLTGRVDRTDFFSALDHATATLEREDTLLVFYAGHGTLESDGLSPSQLYLLTSEARLDRAWETGIPLASIEETLSQVRARRRIVIFDTCHSGQGRSALGAEARAVRDSIRGPLPAPVLAELHSRYEARLYSAHYNQPAIEDPILENGVYTHYLVQALEGPGDLDGDGVVDLMEAHTFARDRTMVRTHNAQEPWYQVTEVGREPVVLSGRAADRQHAERAILVTQPGPWYEQAYALVVDGVPRGPGAIQPGEHTIEVWDRAKLLSSTTRTLDANDRIYVSELVAERDHWWAVAATSGLRQVPQVLTPAFVGLDAWWMPRDPQAGRALLGVHGDWGVGEIADVGQLPAWSARARAAWGIGRGATWGYFGATAGGAWRLRPDHIEAAPLVGLGLYGQAHWRGWFLGLEAEWLWLATWPEGKGTAMRLDAGPSLGLSLGRTR